MAATAAQMGIARADHARRAAGLASSCGQGRANAAAHAARSGHWAAWRLTPATAMAGSRNSARRPPPLRYLSRILAVSVHSSAVQTVGLTDMYMQMHTDGTARQKARAAGESFPSAASSMRRDSCQKRSPAGTQADTATAV